jgi:hypothetical protein
VIAADVAGLAVIVLAGLALAGWQAVEKLAEAEWDRVERAWRARGDIMTALSAEVRARSDRLGGTRIRPRHGPRRPAQGLPAQPRMTGPTRPPGP